MIISEQHRIAFVHIPKCAGSSVREQIEQLHDIPERFTALLDHPELGRIHRAHLPLWALREHYPNAFSHLQEFDVYAICRDPTDRFRSAVAEYFRVNIGREISHCSAEDVREQVQAIIARLRENPTIVDASYCHFIPQSEFIELDGETIANHLYPITEIPGMLTEIRKRTGIAIIPGYHRRQTLEFRFPATEAYLRRAARLAHGYLPLGAYTRIQKLARLAFTRSVPAGNHMTPLSEPAVLEFVRDFYSRDFQLWEFLPRRSSGSMPLGARRRDGVPG